MAYLWTRLVTDEIENLQKQYSNFYPEFKKIEGEPLQENQILQLEESVWFRKRNAYMVFLSYNKQEMNANITLTTFNETDRIFFAETDFCARALARAFKRLIKEQGLTFKILYNAKFNERKHPIPKSELEERTKQLILKFVGLYKKS